MDCKKTIFVPRLADEDNLNPQNKNAQAILSRWKHPNTAVATIAYGTPCAQVNENEFVTIKHLWPRRLWTTHLMLSYFQKCDLIFYPGVSAADHRGIYFRSRFPKRVPIVATLEGLIGNEQRERVYSSFSGHPVYCQRVDRDALVRSDALLEAANHVIAISPFLAEVGRKRFGDKFSAIPLGIDTTIFHDRGRTTSQRVRVVSAGRVEDHKRPEIMLQLAEQNPLADFTWFGEGSQRDVLTRQAAEKNVLNIHFPGPLRPVELAHALRNADIFIMPSKSEGVPKVTQEAAACGLAQVVFGFYEAPTVIHNTNGFVVWDDQQFSDRVSQLLHDPELTETFGRAGAKLAVEQWDWNFVAKQWQDKVCEFLPC